MAASSRTRQQSAPPMACGRRILLPYAAHVLTPSGDMRWCTRIRKCERGTLRGRNIPCVSSFRYMPRLSLSLPLILNVSVEHQWQAENTGIFLGCPALQSEIAPHTHNTRATPHSFSLPRPLAGETCASACLRRAPGGATRRWQHSLRLRRLRKLEREMWRT